MSCSNDDDAIGGISCLDEPKNFTTSNICETNSTDARYCIYINMGDLNLSEKSKEYMPQYCMNVGSNVIFNSSRNEDLIFSITEKSHERHRLFGNYLGNCGEIGLCFTPEIASIVIYSESLNLELEMKLTYALDEVDQNGEKFGNELSIHLINSLTSSSKVFGVIVDPGTHSHGSYNNQLYFESIDLNNNTYSEVLSQSVENGEYKFYCNKDFGLFGIEFPNGELWTLKS